MNRQLLEGLFDGWRRGDFASGVELFAEDVSFSGAQPEGQAHAAGPEGIARFMRRFLEDWERYTVDTQEIEELGAGRYIATGTQHGKGKTSTMDITAPVSIAIRMAEGRITQLEFFLEREQALEALDA